MAYRRGFGGLGPTLSAVVTLGLSSAVAQPPALVPDYTPPADGRDLKAVLANWAWHTGMLRGVDEHELIVSLEHRAEGTVQVNGQPCQIAPFEENPDGELGTSGYRTSIAYQFSASRTQIRCTLPNGQTYSNIEVVSGQYAWDEDIPGAEIVPGEGKAMPMASSAQERLVRLWASPQGAVKAALAGAGIDLLQSFRDPGRLLESGRDRIGETSVSWSAGKPTVTYPIPGVPGASAAATLDERHHAERVVVTHGSTTTEFLYSDYRDWNNPLNLIEAQYAGRITEKHNGTIVRDLQTKQTETGSIYVVVPVPDSVRAAITPGAPKPPPVLFASDRSVTLQSQAPTPRLTDGKPDLSGTWGAAGMFWRYGMRRCGPWQIKGCIPQWNQTVDFEFEAPSRFGPNRPIYRPEHWDKVIALDMWSNREDPVMTCQPLGIPRQGPPRRIYHSVSDITFLYTPGVDGGGGYTEVRVIPTDGRQHDPRQVVQARYTGYGTGHWEGDTLVVETIGFNDYTWLARGGFFHSDQLKVIERFTRQGAEILYEVTIEDPVVLAEPWVMTPRILELNTNLNAGLMPDRGNCEAYEDEDIVTQIRH